MIYVLSGGQTGATLTVTSSGAGTITVSNTSLGKSYSRSVAAGGSAVFKGLATGTWTVKLTDGAKTSTKTITITSDYSTSIAYFSASINITYPATSTCVVTNSSGQTIASDTNTGSSTKTWTATVHATGTYTVTATATDGSGKSKSQSVSITADGQSESVTLSYLYYLYNTGDECTAITGGWKARKQGSGGTFAKRETSIYVQGMSDNGMNAATTNKIDLTPFSTAKIRLIKVSSGGIGKFFFSTSSGYTESGSSNLSLSATSKPKVVSLDIKSLNGLYYAVFLSLNGCEIEFDQVWLEE